MAQKCLKAREEFSSRSHRHRSANAHHTIIVRLPITASNNMLRSNRKKRFGEVRKKQSTHVAPLYNHFLNFHSSRVLITYHYRSTRPYDRRKVDEGNLEKYWIALYPS